MTDVENLFQYIIILCQTRQRSTEDLLFFFIMTIQEVGTHVNTLDMKFNLILAVATESLCKITTLWKHFVAICNLKYLVVIYCTGILCSACHDVAQI